MIGAANYCQEPCDSRIMGLARANGQPPEEKADQSPEAEVSVRARSLPIGDLCDELDRALKELKQVPAKVEEALEDARIAGKYRTQLSKVLREQTERVCEILRQLKPNVRGYQLFGAELFKALSGKGIENMADLEDYFATTESDGELIADICDMFQTNVREVRKVLGDLSNGRTSD
ncbi:unnamed protein product [Heligmosomoides polygyrus]|uniref:Tumor necrosis factor alpha-induced protein 2 n=1 Tax=Heligmosomoides polygyrus TaxID=6339 RepID=A0A183FUT5_HELPZ|nr:unnamed protein product [Heligmosomoides polygyrus]